MRRDSAPWTVSFIFALAWGVTASAQGQVDITHGMSGYQGQNGRIIVVNGTGGNIEQHNAMWRDHARRGGSVRIAGVCRSACTLVFGQIERGRICIAPSARLGFHLGTTGKASGMMWHGYPEDVRA